MDNTNSNNINNNLAVSFLHVLSSKQELANWLLTYLDLYFPDSHVDPDSNSDPIDWMYSVYSMYRDNKGYESPSVIVISSRESYKTLTESALAVLLMFHFRIMCAHMAAILPQANAAAVYVKRFINKLSPYFTKCGWVIEVENEREIVMKTPNGERAGLKIIVCTIPGANSAHVSYFSIDEVDTIRTDEGLRAYAEAEFIPGFFNGRYPVTVKTSTLKFPGGLFSKEKKKAENKGWKIFQWNIIDITEYCPPSRHRPDLPYQDVYIATKLPLQTITVEKYNTLTDQEKEKFIPFKAMGGCAKCPLLPVCKGNLSKRNPNDYGGLWKSIDFTISQFEKVDPDLAEAQLMCWRPSSQGVVYPRFLNSPDGRGNVYTLEQAWKVFHGTPFKGTITYNDLQKSLLNRGIPFYCGVDWGYRHAFAIVVFAIMPNGEKWIVDSYSISNLEWDDMLALGIKIRDLYRPKKWFADTSAPMFIKTFNKNKMPCAKFKKDVQAGIAAIRTQIINSTGQRQLKVIKHDRTVNVITMFEEHCFKLDSLGNLTDEPDDSAVADIADAIRYVGQNLFGPKNKYIASKIEVNPINIPDQINTPFHSWLEQKEQYLSALNSAYSSKGKIGNILWDMSDLSEDSEK